MNDRRNPVPRRRTNDRRQSDRRDTLREFSEAPIRFLRSDGGAQHPLLGELLDASQTGVRLMLDEDVRTSEKLLIEVRDERDRCFNLTAEVVWNEPTGDSRFHVGCELCAELTAKQFARLNEIAQAHGLTVGD